MVHNFKQLEITLDNDGPKRAQWGGVNMKFEDADGCGFFVSVNVLLPHEPNITVGEMKQKALDQAKGSLQAALDLVSTKTVEELKEQQWGTEEAATAAVEYSMTPEGLREAIERAKT